MEPREWQAEALANPHSHKFIGAARRVGKDIYALFEIAKALKENQFRVAVVFPYVATMKTFMATMIGHAEELGIDTERVDLHVEVDPKKENRKVCGKMYGLSILMEAQLMDKKLFEEFAWLPASDKNAKVIVITTGMLNPPEHIIKCLRSSIYHKYRVFAHQSPDWDRTSQKALQEYMTQEAYNAEFMVHFGKEFSDYWENDGNRLHNRVNKLLDILEHPLYKVTINEKEMYDNQTFEDIKDSIMGAFRDTDADRARVIFTGNMIDIVPLTLCPQCAERIKKDEDGIN